MVQDSPEEQKAIEVVEDAATYVSSAVFRDTVEGVKQHEIAVRRALHQIERRTFEFVMEPASKGKPASLAPPSPPSTNPWNVDPMEVREQTRTTCKCTICNGSRRVPCVYCQGTGRVACGTCGGSGKVLGQRKFLKNCPTCRGRATVVCGVCKRGSVTCGHCQGSGRVKAWIEVRQEQWTEVITDASNRELSNYPELCEVRDFSRAAGGSLEITMDDKRPKLSEIPQSLLPSIDDYTERIMSSRAQELRATTWEVRFRTLFGEGAAYADGTNWALLPGSDFRTFTNRFIGALIFGGLLSIIALILHRQFRTQHEWFELYGHPGVILAVGAVGAVAGAFAFLGLTLPRAARSATRTWIPFGVTTAALLILIAFFRFSAPTVEEAEQALAQGHYQKAGMIAEALMALRIDHKGGARIVDELHLGAVKSAPTIEKMAYSAHHLWRDPAYETKALAHLSQAVVAETESRYKSKNIPGLQKLLQTAQELDEKTVLLPIHQKIALLQVQSCLDAGETTCIAGRIKHAREMGITLTKGDPLILAASSKIKGQFQLLIQQGHSSEKLNNRWKSFSQAIALNKTHSEIVGESMTPSVETIQTWLDATAKQMEENHRAQQAKQAAAARRWEREQEQRAKRQAAQEKRRRRQAYRGRVRCRDGTVSPTCRCGGSLRGCCSWHGGVAGCF